MIRGTVEKLRDEIEEIGLDLNAIKSGLPRVLCRLAKIVNCLPNLAFGHWPGSYGGFSTCGSDAFLPQTESPPRSTFRYAPLC
jgi:hypothetical protein